MQKHEHIKDIHKIHIENVAKVIRRQLQSEGFSVTQELAEKEVVHGMFSIREEMCKKKCPHCGKKALKPSIEFSEGKEVAVLYCENCKKWF